MREHFIDLNDGTRMEIRVNFGTMFYLQKCGGAKLAEKLHEKQNKKIKPNDNESMEFAAKVIYATLRSNGRAVSFDEAISLMPIDTTEIEELLGAYQDEVEKVKKKQEAKKMMKSISQK